MPTSFFVGLRASWLHGVADLSLADAASQSRTVPSASSLTNVKITCDSIWDNTKIDEGFSICSNGSVCLNGDFGVYCQCYVRRFTSKEVRTVITRVIGSGISLYNSCLYLNTKQYSVLTSSNCIIPRRVRLAIGVRGPSLCPTEPLLSPWATRLEWSHWRIFNHNISLLLKTRAKLRVPLNYGYGFFLAVRQSAYSFLAEGRL